MHTITHRRATAAATLTAGLLGILVLAGCEQPQGPAPITLAFTATSNEPAPGVNEATHNQLVDYAKDALFPEDAKVNVIVQGQDPQSIDLTPLRGDEVENDPSKATGQIEQHLLDLEDNLATQSAGTDGLDTLGVYAKAVDVTPTGGTIVMTGSGISTVDPLDLTKAGNWTSKPSTLVSKIDPQQVPDATGRHVVFTGLGYPGGRQGAPTTEAHSALGVLWTEICQASHAASCTIEPGPASSVSTSATNTVPVVNFTPARTPCVGTITVNADVAFAPDSSVLTRAADTVLGPIARDLIHCPPGRVLNAYGHTAEVPGSGDGIARSRERAQAVLDRLRQLGAPTDTLGGAIGYGSASHQIVDNTPDGIYSEPLAVRNRVVELTYATH